MLEALGAPTDRGPQRVPDFFTEFLPHVKIESDDKKNPGPIPFYPWAFQSEIFEKLLAGENIVWLKRRQIGASWVMAIYTYWMAAYHEDSHVGIISIGQREADWFAQKVRYIHHFLPDHLKRACRGERHIKFEESRSSVIAFPSTEFSGVSFTFRLLIVDEAAMHPYGERNYNNYAPSIAAGGQLAMASTSNQLLGPSGFFYQMWHDTESGETGYTPIFSGRYCRPDQGADWFKIEVRRFRGSKDGFAASYPQTPEEAFVGRSGLVYPQFERILHVRESDPRPWAEYDYRVAGIDPGGGDPTAICVFGVWRDKRDGTIRWHQPKAGEFYRSGSVSFYDIIEFLSKWPKLDRIYLDTAGGTVLLNSLKQHGFNVYPAWKDREMGHSMYAELLDHQHLTHHESNVHTIQEYYSYRWLERTDPNDKARYRTSTPVDHHADAKDATRYAIVGFTKALSRHAASAPKLKLVV